MLNRAALRPSALRPRLKAADFQQALGNRPVARSAHFTVHFAAPTVNLVPRAAASRARASACPDELSTGTPPEVVEPVDVCAEGNWPGALVWRLGLVLPKRMARRSVTRSLIKHQARELWRLHAPALLQAGWLTPAQPAGNWVLRLKAPWPKQEFPSAASEPLKLAVQAELQAMLAHLARGVHKSSPRPPRPEGSA